MFILEAFMMASRALLHDFTFSFLFILETALDGFAT
nr:MAG TPA: hypothetical protein [Caudoviricetes sp.]